MRRINNSNIYLSTNSLIDFGSLNNNIKIDYDLNIKYIEDAYICGGRSEHDSTPHIKVKNKFDEIIDHCPYRETNNTHRFLPTHVPVTIVKEPYIFGGLVHNHYGHFITESLSRFSLCKKFSLKFALFVYSMPQSSMPQSFKDFLNDCHIQYDIFDIRSNNFIFNQIFIPAPGLVLGRGSVNYYHKNISKMVDTQIVPSKNKILYISKKKYCQANHNHGGTTIDYNFEQKIEDFLVNTYGAQIIYPDEHSIKNQINAINEHEIIIGPCGSNMHTILLAKDPKKVVYIISTPVLKETGPATGRLMGYVKSDLIKNNKSFYLMDDEVDVDLRQILDFLTEEGNMLDYNRWKASKNYCNNIRSDS